MKRNLSSQAIRAMAIGMAVTLGSATAVSGVVEVKAEEVSADSKSDEAEESQKLENGVEIPSISVDEVGSPVSIPKAEGSTLKNTKSVITADGLVFNNHSNENFNPVKFERTKEDAIKNPSDITVDLVGVVSNAESKNDIKSTVENGLLIVEENNKFVALKIVEIKVLSNYKSENKVNLISAQALQNAMGIYLNKINFDFTVPEGTPGGSYIPANAAKGAFTDMTIEGNLELDFSKFQSSLNSSNFSSLTFKNATINGDLIIKNDKGVKDSDKKIFKDVIRQFINGVTIKGNLDLTGADLTKYDQSIAVPKLNAATINGKIILSGDKLEADYRSLNVNTKNGKTIIDIIGKVNTENKIEEIFKSAYENGEYRDEYTKSFILNLPYNTSKEVYDAIIKSIDKNKNDSEVNIKNIEAENNGNKYTFKVIQDKEREVALIDFKGSSTRNMSEPTVKFENGKVKTEDQEYTLTTIGDGEKAVPNLTSEALKGHTNSVTIIEKDAFKNNEEIKGDLTFPVVKEVRANAFEGTKIENINLPEVTNVGENAFTGASALTTVDLGSKANSTTIASTALTGAKSLKEVKTNDKSIQQAKEAVEKSDSKDITIKNSNDKVVEITKPSEPAKPSEPDNNGGGSSSGGSGGGSGANIGTITNKEPNTEETTSQGNNNNETVVENKQLSFDVIKLPSVEGEAKVFGDVSANHWAKSYIDKLSTAGIINGSNGMFNPNGQTKRADVTVMLVNLLGLTTEANNKFADVNASAYYAPYVGTASTYGIVNGSNGMFNPQGVISRQDTMVMIAQILKGLNLNVNADTTALSQFGDVSKVSAYANESVAILVNSGIIAGNNGKLNPTAPVTRAEMATIMSKLYDVLASANK